ncbi:Serine/threonine protein kinase [Trichoderma parareesei]|uniref:Serine/threonine protein kinase n=1 Tax=Trichoderma parareesei TaxID=858221 RepID=A0A2H2ZCM6_TRIPA|nr:Serine/threonine protein kinase [Trichoderma parareesei]
MPSQRHQETAAAARPLPPAPGAGEEVAAGESLSNDEGIVSPRDDAEMERASPAAASSSSPGRLPPPPSAMRPPPGFEEEPSAASGPREEAPPSSAGEHPNPLGCSPVEPEHFPESLGLGHYYEAQGVRERDWDLPGAETAPTGYNDRPVTGHWMSGEFILVKVGGKSFQLPMRLLSKYPFWNALLYLEQPPQGWSMPGVDADIFVVLMECVYSTSGLHGTEDGLNLMKLCYAYLLAGRWGMPHDKRKLRDTAYRYVVRKIFFFNPHLAEDQGHLHQGHFRYRSEELYRTWELVRRYPALEKIVSQGDLVSMYTVTVHPSLWADLAEQFDPLFPELVEASLERRLSSDQNAFQNWFLRFFRLAGYSDFGWLSREAADRFFGPLHLDDDGTPVPLQFRTEFAASRARTDALINEYQVRQDQGQPLSSATPAYAEGDAHVKEDADAEGEPITDDELYAEGEPVSGDNVTVEEEEPIVEEDVDVEGESTTKDDVLPGPSILSTPTRRSDPGRRPRVHHGNRVRFADQTEIFEIEPYQGPSFAASRAAASAYQDMDPMDCDPFVD